MRLLPISSCNQCPNRFIQKHYTDVDPAAGSTWEEIHQCLNMDSREIPDPNQIPDWCRLQSNECCWGCKYLDGDDASLGQYEWACTKKKAINPDQEGCDEWTAELHSRKFPQNLLSNRVAPKPQVCINKAGPEIAALLGAEERAALYIRRIDAEDGEHWHIYDNSLEPDTELLALCGQYNFPLTETCFLIELPAIPDNVCKNCLHKARELGYTGLPVGENAIDTVSIPTDEQVEAWLAGKAEQLEHHGIGGINVSYHNNPKHIQCSVLWNGIHQFYGTGKTLKIAIAEMFKKVRRERKALARDPR